MTLAGGAIAAEEVRRLDAIRRYDILDTPPDGAFDRVTALAARICRTPISTITIVDHDRIWFKSTHGIEVQEIGRDPGLCASAVLQDEAWVVTNAAVDPRTLDNPLVCGELGLRFYVGVPLRTEDGYRLGTLNVIDVEERELTADQLASLHDLASVVMDELELRLAARRTIELEAARERARLRESVIAGISHEMLTPLAVLGGALDLDESPVGVDARRRAELHRMMRRQVWHLDWLVKKFLDYARLESGTYPALDKSPVDLGAVATSVAELFADRAPIALEIVDPAPFAEADAERTLQIVSELLHNAVRFAGPDSPVTIRVARGVGDTRITVADKGPGVPSHAVERVFEKFIADHEHGGSGLGLYLSRVLAESQRGRIEVETRPGEGAAFTLVLPAAPDGSG